MRLRPTQFMLRHEHQGRVFETRNHLDEAPRSRMIACNRVRLPTLGITEVRDVR